MEFTKKIKLNRCVAVISLVLAGFLWSPHLTWAGGCSDSDAGPLADNGVGLLERMAPKVVELILRKQEIIRDLEEERFSLRWALRNMALTEREEVPPPQDSQSYAFWEKGLEHRDDYRVVLKRRVREIDGQLEIHRSELERYCSEFRWDLPGSG